MVLQPHSLEQRLGKGGRLVGQHRQRQSCRPPGIEPGKHAFENTCLFAVDRGIVQFENLDGTGKQRLIRGIPLVQAATHEDDGALPDEAADFAFAAQWQAEFRQHAITGLDQIGQCIAQCTVEVEGD